MLSDVPRWCLRRAAANNFGKSNFSFIPHGATSALKPLLVCICWWLAWCNFTKWEIRSATYHVFVCVAMRVKNFGKSKLSCIPHGNISALKSLIVCRWWWSTWRHFAKWEIRSATCRVSVRVALRPTTSANQNSVSYRTGRLLH